MYIHYTELDPWLRYLVCTRDRVDKRTLMVRSLETQSTCEPPFRDLWVTAGVVLEGDTEAHLCELTLHVGQVGGSIDRDALLIERAKQLVEQIEARGRDLVLAVEHGRYRITQGAL